ncbi:MAG: MinD/ParA family protein [Acidobacteria bacterium]|nr:MAG: MinD/ParA family protein [Acidobacteriota bacterium]
MGPGGRRGGDTVNGRRYPRSIRRARRALALAIASGKGGVGKTTVAGNLALALARTGLSVVVLDGDLGLANVDVLLGMTPHRTLEHFFREGVPIEEIVHRGPGGVGVVPAGSGMPELTRLTLDELVRLAGAIDALRAECDVLLIDTPAGIGDDVSRLAQLSDRVLLVTWPEPTALVDAYAVLKVFRRQRPDLEVGLLVNGVADAAEAERVHRQLDRAALRFLGRGVALQGHVVRDEAVREASRRQRAVVAVSPLSPAARCFERLALRIAALAGAYMRGVTGEETGNAVPAELVH